MCSSTYMNFNKKVLDLCVGCVEFTFARSCFFLSLGAGGRAGWRLSKEVEGSVPPSMSSIVQVQYGYSIYMYSIGIAQVQCRCSLSIVQVQFTYSIVQFRYSICTIQVCIEQVQYRYVQYRYGMGMVVQYRLVQYSMGIVQVQYMFSLGIVERLSKEVEGKRATVNIGTTNTYRKADQHGHKFVMMKTM